MAAGRESPSHQPVGALANPLATDVGVTAAIALASPCSAQDFADGKAVADEEIVVTAAASYPNGIAKEATLGIFGPRDLLDTPISSKSFDNAFISSQLALSANEVASRDASYVPTGSASLTGADGGLLRGFRALTIESSFDGYTNLFRRRELGPAACGRPGRTRGETIPIDQR